jgi:hypothetical protein
MDAKYLLTQLFTKTVAMRKAQRDYYAYKGDMRTDPIKKAYLQESQRREQDVDKLIVQLPIAMPELNGVIRESQG